MKHSNKCMALVKKYEGFSSIPYKCPAGVWTIGYGTTNYPSGKKVLRSDRSITEQEASEFLNNQLLRFSRQVHQFILEKKLTINQNQFDALVSFSYNLGLTPLFGEGKALNIAILTENPNLVAEAMKRYVFAKGVKLPGLVKRRDEEAALYLEEA